MKEGVKIDVAEQLIKKDLVRRRTINKNVPDVSIDSDVFAYQLMF